MPDPDFFVSHADDDQLWAEWVAAELKAAGYGVIVKAWDFVPGENRLTRLDEALAASKHTLCLLSQAYLDSEVATRTAAYYQDLQGKERALIPVQIGDCTVPPLLGPIIAIDLSDVDDEDEARRRLLGGVAGRAGPVARGKFPRSRGAQARFPKGSPEILELRGHREVPYFIGRDEVLSALHRDLRSGRPASAVQVLTGLGGQGKTGLVVEYARRYATAYDLVWWIRAEDPATLRGDYVELAAELGLPAEKDDQAIAALRRELRRRRDWLLIVDNAEDPDELFPLLPERLSGHVLVTSRLRDWPHAETRQLDVLSSEAAAEYLQRRGRVADRGMAREIGDALGCLPLALVQAASVIADMGADDYLDLLRRQSPRLFAEGRTPDRDMTIATTWRVSVDRLAKRSAAALALFRLAAFLAADTIPLARLTATDLMPPELTAALADPIQRARATAALGEYSLAETAGGQLSIHRLVQAVTRLELGQEAAHWAGIALSTIAAAFPATEQDPRSWPACEDVLAHALAAAGHAVELDTDTIATVRLLDRVARYLIARARLDSAEAVLEQALAAAGHLDDKDPVHLSCRNTYGKLLFAQGHYSAAQAVHEQTYEVRAQVLGPDSPDTLRSGRDVVQVLYVQGHRVQAARLHEGLVDAFNATFGPDDPETITAQAYLATILQGAGQYVRSRVINEQVVEARTRLLGEEHPDTLLARLELARTLHYMGELKQARVINEQVVEARSRVLGEEHPDALEARADLAVTLGQLGELKQARVIEEQVVETRIRVMGEEHRETLVARGNLAGTLAKMGELKQARVIEDQVVEARARVLGEEHPDTLIAKGNLASILRDMGKPEQARTVAEQVLEAQTRVLGEEHPDTLISRVSLAAALGAMGEMQQARTLTEQVLEVQTRVLGEEHPKTLETKLFLATALLALTELEQARVVAEQLVASRTRLLGEAHLDTLGAIAILAAILAAQDHDDEAFSLLTKSLEIARRVFGERHTATTEAAWRLTESCGPHQAALQRRLMIQYLSWLPRAHPDHLSANQKQIKKNLGGTGPAGRRPPQGRGRRR